MVSKMSYCPLDEAWTLCKPLETNFEPENTKLEIGGYSLDNADSPFRLDNAYTQSSPVTSYSLSDKQLSENKIENDFAAFIRGKNDPEQANKERSKELVFKDSGHSGNKSDFCKALLRHLDECPTCREKMRERFGGGQEVLEKFQNSVLNGVNKTPNYLEILMVILIGVIIIVIMDCFVRLGKMVKN